ncbi:MAG: DUF202 domain-containing protein [Polyangiaceae bacterium]
MQRRPNAPVISGRALRFYIERVEPETLRLHQANERTLLAWIRTGIALMAFGFAIARFALFLQQIALAGELRVHVQQGVGSSFIGAALVAVGMLVNLVSTIRFAHVRRHIARGRVGAPNATLVYAFGATATLVASAMTALLVRAIGD